MYEIIIHKSVKKAVNKQQKHIKEAFYNWINNELPKNPYKANDGKMKGKLYKGSQPYRKRFGAYRAIYIIKEKLIIIEIYK